MVNTAVGKGIMDDSSASDDELGGSDFALTDEYAEEELLRWMTCKHWVPDEALYLLNGLDPRESRDGEAEGNPFVHLPHGLAPNRESFDPETLRLNIEGDLEFTKRYIDTEGITKAQTP